MLYELPPLPYEQNALEPYISSETISYHYGKHHQTYVNNLNRLIEGSPLKGRSLEEVILNSEGGIFNNSAQVWNHTFYWNCLTPNPSKPSNGFCKEIEKTFGSFDAFLEQLKNSAVTLFGSGWAWLVFDNGDLKIVQTSNADLPMRHNQTALLTIDVWEHAYYIDYRNDRAKYVEQILKNLINWRFVEENYEKARS